MSDDDIEARVDLMARVFIARLPVRFEKMQEAFALCRASPQAPENWLELHRLLHSLAGAAGTFGCDGLGVQASRIEQRITDLLALPERTHNHVEEIGHALAGLQAAA
ncbi:Hpt domain-containing protein [Massilia sp. PAMC28688]|uniref:Hpt domain-containing protein n=1 Tax=Massilia sp. PAMC28688 TaxID=2861283 RepID=UPI001C63A01E|nr:Hpt domain-containing protein [Massilia sp. PAMC28688]QYF95619.1 Hpt domain-containing protein [Massilia sp. PAMC28688]